jgi:hypothetical protein
MKYFVAVVLFLAGITFTLLTTPAAHAGGAVFVNTPGRVFFPNSGFGCFNGFCNSPCFGSNNIVTPGFFNPFTPVVNPVFAQPVIFNTTGIVDNIYGPGASAARRMAPLRNSNFYHGW